MATVAFTTRANLVGGQPENIADVTSCLDALLAGVNSVATAQIADLAVTDAKVAASTLTDTKLASPGNAAWRTIYSASGVLQASDASGNNILTGGACIPVSTGTLVGGKEPAVFGFDPAEYAITSKTLQIRLSVAGATNSTSAGGNVALNMVPITSSAGAAGTITVGVGASVVGVTVTPPTSSAFAGVGSAITAPSSGVYCLCFNTTSAIAASSAVFMRVFVQARYV